MTCGLSKGVALVVLLAVTPALAAEAPPAGATSCSGCHATGDKPGIVPSITGRAADEIVGAMAEFREGKRPATVMDRIAKGFSDDEMRAIAKWLAGMK